jgi:hypothetical protein
VDSEARLPKLAGGALHQELLPVREGPRKCEQLDQLRVQYPARNVRVFPGDFNVRVDEVLQAADIIGPREAAFCLLDQRTFECRWKASTSLVERSNLTLRTFNRRFTRLTCAFSKRPEHHRKSVALSLCIYNFVRRHGTLKTTPAVAAGVTYREWTIRDLLEW